MTTINALQPRHQWSALNKLQLGRYAEYYTCLRFAEAGFEVFPSAVDDRGIDLLVRIGPGRCLEIQVKGERPKPGATSYTFVRKHLLGQTPDEIAERLAKSYFVSFLSSTDGREPEMYLIPGRVWLTPTAAFCSRDYDKPGQKSKAEFGISLGRNRIAILEPFRFSRDHLANLIRDLAK